MTKYEWESELRKNIHRLPSDEIKRVMEYYDELFADKIERGYGELEIISQFGNPVDVADKIISEYDGEFDDGKKESAPVYESKCEDKKRDGKKQDTEEEKREDKEQETKDEKPKAEKKKEKETRRLNGSALALFIVLNVVTVFAFFIVIGVLWIALCAVTVSGFACIGGGVLEAIFSLFDVFRGYVAAGFAKVGMCVAAVGVGVLLVSIIGKVFVFYGKACAKIFKWIGNWICPKQV